MADDPTSRAAADETALSAQIDAMLAQIDAADAEEAKASTGALAHQSAPPSGAAPDLVGDHLAKQIQEMLDTAEPAAAGLGADAANATAAVGSAGVGADLLDIVEPADVGQVDELLAANAEQAVAGEFETLSEVLAQEPAATATVPAAVETHQPSAAAVGGAAALAAAAPAAAAPAPAAEPQLHDDDLEGEFETPEAVIHGITPAASAALEEPAPPAAAAPTEPPPADVPAQTDREPAAAAPPATTYPSDWQALIAHLLNVLRRPSRRAMALIAAAVALPLLIYLVTGVATTTVAGVASAAGAAGADAFATVETAPVSTAAPAAGGGGWNWMMIALAGASAVALVHPRLRPHRRRLRRAVMERLLTLCVWISRPLRDAPPEVRSLIGWFGMGHVVLALVLLLSHAMSSREEPPQTEYVRATAVETAGARK